MFITRFVKADGSPNEDYYYHSSQEAVDHMNLFQNDDSGLYKNISVLNEKTNTVICILPFAGGIPKEVIREGSIVRFDHRYCTEGERKYLFVVRNINESSEKLVITCINSKMAISPSEDVGIEMVIPIQNAV